MIRFTEFALHVNITIHYHNHTLSLRRFIGITVMDRSTSGNKYVTVRDFWSSGKKWRYFSARIGHVLCIFCYFLLRVSNKFVDFKELKIVDLHQHLAGHDRRETSSGADSDPNKSTVHRNSRSSRKVQKAKGSLHLTAR